MNDHNKTKQQLIQELATLRRQIVQMEEAHAGSQQRDDALQESEELYTKLVDTIPDVVIRFDLEGKILFVNDYALQISGYSREEVEGQSMFMFIAPEDHGKVIENSILMMERRLGPKEYHLVMKDGRKILFEVNGDVLRNQEGIPFGLVHVCRDITDRKQMEEELHASEEKYRLLVENAMIGIFWINDSFQFIYVNDHLCQILGCSKNELIGKDFREVLSNDSRDFISDRYTRRQRGERMPDHYEIEIVRPDGQIRNVEMMVSIMQDRTGRMDSIGQAIDVTERKRSEEALQESEEKYRTILENIEDGYYETDLKGDLTFFNDSLCRIPGYPREELMGMNYRQYIDAENADEVFSAYHDVYKTGVPARGFSWPIIRKDGSKRYIETSVSLIKDSSGNPIGFRGINRDITERKCAEDEKRSLEERLNRAEKMEALGQLAGGVAHDLNNVLGVLTGYSELLLMEIPEGQRARSHVEKILQSAEKGAAIIQDLLTLARRGVTASEVLNLNTVVSSFLKTPVLEKIKNYHPHVTFRTECQGGLLNIKGSPVHLEKTLMNLVSNAAEAIAGEGEVTIRTENRYLDNAIMGYDEVKEGDYVVLTVSDTGMGIPAENKEKIFEPFYTKKTMGRSGTGLGLSIVWGTVKDHNGYIDVQSNAGEGSTFTLYFPATREALTVPQQKSPKEHYMGNGESVLVVDDIAEQRDVASGLLIQLGYKVHAVSGGEEAVEYLKSHQADILVLDMIMIPGIDGLETYRRVLEINPKQKAVLVSGFSETDRLREAQKLGAGAYVKKPYVMEQIGVAIRDELKR